eukprot:CAMPEP_0177655004 /NCGR_PEP_ID=MMETSP0447-20121125/14691_1 /TAXON_ID=0 /ORGANISM="Stygamoeba regulata, Strain BSH-02190019" /LENGTH=398 /DNA_ID=CAMNT_0019158805 /DNA_START=65 /DNA_END=1262 /DNA_ORIENTATION=-
MGQAASLLLPSRLSPRALFNRARLLARVLLCLVLVSARRVWRGPIKPGWAFKTEVVLLLMQLGRNAHVDIGKARAAMAKFSRPAPAWMRVVRTAVPSHGSAPARPAVWLIPPALHSAAAAPSPVARTILYLHGGGYCLGGIPTHERFASYYAHNACAQVLLIDYRLAPEHPFPAALEDAVAAYAHLLALGIPAQNIVFMGDSAGGGLSFALALKLHGLQKSADAHALPLPAAVATLSPWTDLSFDTENLDNPALQQRLETLTFFSNAKYDYLPTRNFDHWLALYIGSDSATNPLISPTYARTEDLAALPPALVIVGGAEQLYGDCVRFAKRLKSAGVPTELHVFPDMPHVFQAFGSMFAESRTAIDRCCDFVMRHAGPCTALPGPYKDPTEDAPASRI